MSFNRYLPIPMLRPIYNKRYVWMETMWKNITKMANSLEGCIALLRQLASFCKGWATMTVAIARYVLAMICMDSRGWGEPTYIYIYISIIIYIYIVYTIYALLDLASLPPKQNFWLRQWLVLTNKGGYKQEWSKLHLAIFLRRFVNDLILIQGDIFVNVKQC